MRRQSVEEKTPPHMAKDPPRKGALFLTRVNPPLILCFLGAFHIPINLVKDRKNTFEEVENGSSNAPDGKSDSKVFEDPSGAGLPVIVHVLTHDYLMV